MAKKKQTKKQAKARPSKASSKNRRMAIILALIPALLGFLIYANTLGHDYALDDYSAIKDNYVTMSGIEGLPDIFTKHYRYGYWNGIGTLYRPISLAMFAVEWQIAPDSPGFYHFINVLLYALTGFLLFWTLYKLFPKQGLIFPFLVSLLFMSHPLHVEVVANIKSRDEILTFLFGLLAIYSLWKYLDQKKISWLLGSLAAYTIALFSKETAITFLAVFPLVGYFSQKKNLPESFILGAAFLAPAGLYLIARKAVLGNFASLGKISALDNVIAGAPDKLSGLPTAFLLGGKYLKNLILPHPLGSDFGFNQIPLTDWSDWRVWLSILAFIAIAYFALRNFLERSTISFGLSFFIITFSIFSNIIILIGTSYGDRLMYIPSFGIAIALVALLLHFLKIEVKDKTADLATFFRQYSLPILIVGAVSLLYSFKTISRNPVWENSFTLYDADIKGAPNSAKLNYHYALELNKKGLEATVPQEKGKWWDQAMFYFLKAVEIDPTYGDGYGQLGLMYYRQKDFAKAMESYNRSLEYKPDNAKVYSNMGIIYFEQGNLTKAQEVYENAVRIDPRFVDARRNLGSVYAQQRQFDKAIAQFKEALKYDPNNATLHLYMGYVYRDKGDTTNAQIYLEKAYGLNPSLRGK